VEHKSESRKRKDIWRICTVSKRELLKIPVPVLKWPLGFPAREKSIGAGCAHQDLRHNTYTLCPKLGSVALPNVERGHEAVESP